MTQQLTPEQVYAKYGFNFQGNFLLDEDFKLIVCETFYTKVPNENRMANQTVCYDVFSHRIKFVDFHKCKSLDITEVFIAFYIASQIKQFIPLHLATKISPFKLMNYVKQCFLLHQDYLLDYFEKIQEIFERRYNEIIKVGTCVFRGSRGLGYISKIENSKGYFTVCYENSTEENIYSDTLLADILQDKLVITAIILPEEEINLIVHSKMGETIRFYYNVNTCSTMCKPEIQEI